MIISRSLTRATPTPHHAGSEAWFGKAKEVLAGGISSSARATAMGRLPHPLYIERGLGGSVWDVDGNRYTDYLLGYGSAILGHSPPATVRAISEQAARGTMFGTCNTTEVLLAAKIREMAPCAELVRFANSGSEAICGAVRAARGFTGRSKVLKFEGHYHGWVDVLAVSNRPSQAEWGPIERPANRPHSRGIPPGVYDDVIVCPWNDPEILVALMNAHAGELAAVIAEPIVANNACLMPLPGYLEMLREECSKRGVVLIYDEIVTGFRVATGGAQALFGVIPDLAVYSKALGGGMPISAFCGRREIMQPVAENVVKHGGTYNGNPICTAASFATLNELSRPDTLGRVREAGAFLAEVCRKAASDFGVPCVVQGMGGMFQVIFLDEDAPLTQYRHLQRADSVRFAAFWQALFVRGVHINSSGMACWFTSAAHTDGELSLTAEAIRAAFKSIA